MAGNSVSCAGTSIHQACRPDISQCRHYLPLELTISSARPSLAENAIGSTDGLACFLPSTKLTSRLIFAAPWVEPKYSDILSLQMAKMLPTGVLKQWNKVMKFVVTKAAPSLSSSVDILSSMGGSIPRGSTEDINHREPILTADEIGPRTAKQLENLCIEYIFLEDTTGMNDEAVVCLKKTAGLWGACEDLPIYIRWLVQAEEWYKQGHPEEQKPLQVKAIFAEKDGMIGPQGQKYFENCFAPINLNNVVSFQSVMEKGTGHDTLWASETGAFLKVMEDIKEATSQ